MMDPRNAGLGNANANGMRRNNAPVPPLRPDIDGVRDDMKDMGDLRALLELAERRSAELQAALAQPQEPRPPDWAQRPGNPESPPWQQPMLPSPAHAPQESPPWQQPMLPSPPPAPQPIGMPSQGQGPGPVFAQACSPHVVLPTPDPRVPMLRSAPGSSVTLPIAPPSRAPSQPPAPIPFGISSTGGLVRPQSPGNFMAPPAGMMLMPNGCGCVGQPGAPGGYPGRGRPTTSTPQAPTPGQVGTPVGMFRMARSPSNARACSPGVPGPAAGLPPSSPMPCWAGNMMMPRAPSVPRQPRQPQPAPAFPQAPMQSLPGTPSPPPMQPFPQATAPSAAPVGGGGSCAFTMGGPVKVAARSPEPRSNSLAAPAGNGGAQAGVRRPSVSAGQRMAVVEGAPQTSPPARAGRRPSKGFTASTNPVPAGVNGSEASHEKGAAFTTPTWEFGLAGLDNLEAAVGRLPSVSPPTKQRPAPVSLDELQGSTMAARDLVEAMCAHVGVTTTNGGHSNQVPQGQRGTRAASGNRTSSPANRREISTMETPLPEPLSPDAKAAVRGFDVAKPGVPLSNGAPSDDGASCNGREAQRSGWNSLLPSTLEILSKDRVCARARVYLYQAPFAPSVLFVRGNELFALPQGWGALRSRRGLLVWLELMDDSSLRDALALEVAGFHASADGSSSISLRLQMPGSEKVDNPSDPGRVPLQSMRTCSMESPIEILNEDVAVLNPRGKGEGVQAALGGEGIEFDSTLLAWLSAWETCV